MDRFSGKVVVVMGAGQTPGETIGNGRAAAVLYAQEGARVVSVDLSMEAAEQTADLIRGDGGSARALRADVTREDEVNSVVENVLATWGTIDVLHNNVGVSFRAGDAPITEIDPEAFTRVTSINVLGMVLACKHVIPVMKSGGGGAIINIGSAASLIDYPNIGYKTSKTAVVALTENVAIRHAADGIRSNAVLPGLMDTPMAVERYVESGAGTRDAVVADRIRRNPLHAHGSAWDVAKASAFLASDDAAFITGVSVVVDGGQHLVVG